MDILTDFLGQPLVFVWWNTSLSPLGTPRGTQDDLDIVVRYLKAFREEWGADVIGLGEVSTSDLIQIMEHLDDPHLTLHDATGAVNGTRFDIALLYDKRRLHQTFNRPLIATYGNHSLKIGERIDLISSETEVPLTVVVSHWPSRLFAPDFAPKRAEMGMALRSILDTIRDDFSEPYLVLMGDYNDDPFSPALADHLLATRDRELARRSNPLLYNPSWRWIGESLPHGADGTDVGVCGTYYYRSGTPTRWHTFDQIMFSSAFLRSGTFTLRESLGRIISTSDLVERLRSATSIFDHLPVLAAIDVRV
ncbi:endonuclease/exonuclease/phosphatase family protein [Paraburkholderia sp. XV]|uniref:endonuclease/exonuclease/phosphatase family protein n=1 Tax=Paraburkholderia sp. XV TaxID=2831520 RepID=UPI001CD476C9|nr:endonuclease/exonuclease/phosphatase family protein [Paraburkholderia sp. XV]